MTETQEFSLQGECVKCGAFCKESVVVIEQIYDQATKRWVENKRTVAGNISTTFVKLTPGARCLCGRTDAKEHLHRKCLVCGYYWSEETMESQVEQN